MQFKVPQFLEIEDKIFGPFTFRQFVYLAGGAGLCFVCYRLLGLMWGAVPILSLAGFSLALAFYRPNNKPFINMLESSIRFVTQAKLYIWKRRIDRDFRSESKRATSMTNNAQLRAPRLDKNKLRDLAWSLDVLDLEKQHPGP